MLLQRVQVAEQRRVVNEYEQDVARVAQDIEIMGAQNQAKIANISAGAVAESKTICAKATRDAFRLKQRQKAVKYAEIQRKFSLTEQQLTEYLKIRALQGQSGNAGTLKVSLIALEALQALDAPGAAGAGAAGAARAPAAQPGKLTVELPLLR